MQGSLKIVQSFAQETLLFYFPSAVSKNCTEGSVTLSSDFRVGVWGDESRDEKLMGSEIPGVAVKPQ